MAWWSEIRGRTSAALLVCAAVSVACQDGYPIPPTQCDEWCRETRRIECGTFDPASCVVACEKAGIGRPACASFVAETIQCLHGKTDAELNCAVWSFTGQAPCLEEQVAAQQCGSAGGHAGSQGNE